jgi:twitching motility two-component system response regulator PilH
MARILIVDDSPTEMHVIKTMLAKHGYQSLEAVNGEDGVAKAKEELPDLILMDIVMPGMNGFQATRRLSKEPSTASIPIIIVSTKGQETDRVWAMRQGAKDYMTKPVNESELVEKIRSALGE